MSRRDALDLELRDEHDAVFDCDFMRVYEVESLIAEVLEQREERELLGSGWPPTREDPRWDTMQYQLQVHLKASFDDDDNLPGSTFTGSTE